MVLLLSILTKMVLGILVALSVVSIKTIIEVRRRIRSFATDSQWKGLESISEENLAACAGFRRQLFQMKQPHRRSALMLRWKSELEEGLGLLATIGANAPFVGLFGTVLGIIQAFQVLSQTDQGATPVMSAIAEALVATAVGLAVAIPAVAFYNSLSRSIRRTLDEAEAIHEWLGN